MLLYSDELIFIEIGGRWSFSTGSTVQLLRKNPYVPNPLTPDSLLFRVNWSAAALTPGEGQESAIRQIKDALSPLRYTTVALFMLLLVAFPLFLLFGPRFWLGILVGVIYLVILVMLVQIYSQRTSLGYTGRQFVVMAFEALACAPLALNLVRRITLGSSIITDPVSFAQRFFDADAFSSLVTTISHAVDEALEEEGEVTSHRLELEAYRKRIANMVT